MDGKLDLITIIMALFLISMPLNLHFKKLIFLSKWLNLFIFAPILKFDYNSITARDHCHLNVNCWFGFSCWVKQSFECICCLVFRNSYKNSKFTHVNWVEGNKQRSYQRWLDKRIYKTEMKFRAGLGSRGCREKNSQLP